MNLLCDWGWLVSSVSGSKFWDYKCVLPCSLYKVPGIKPVPAGKRDSASSLVSSFTDGATGTGVLHHSLLFLPLCPQLLRSGGGRVMHHQAVLHRRRLPDTNLGAVSGRPQTLPKGEGGFPQIANRNLVSSCSPSCPPGRQGLWDWGRGDTLFSYFVFCLVKYEMKGLPSSVIRNGYM